MKVLKSIKSFYPCKFYSILVFLMTIITYTNSVVANDKFKKMIIQDLPAATDFDHYLSALEKAVDFCMRYKHYVDLNMKFGLILIDVNLRRILQQKRTRIPADTRSRLENLFVKNDVVNDYFKLMVQIHQNDSEIAQNKQLVQLFYNATTWPKPLDKFNTNLLAQTTYYTLKQLEDIYGEWWDYHNTVDNYAEMKPSPDESNECFAHLALNDPLHVNGTSQMTCLTPHHCIQAMLGGNEFGYGLAHRILYMVVARFSRRCVLLSRRRDRANRNVFCQKCFNELNYIAINGFKLPDVMYAQIALCGLFGHAQFLRNNWLKSPLQFQTTEGCFSEKISTGDFNETQLRNEFNDTWKIVRPFAIMNEQCNGPFTAMAMGALSNALRYILETFYQN